MADTEGLSIEETNKLRAQLGLKPLRVAAPKPAEDVKKDEEDRKQREQEQRDAEALARLEKVRAKRAITAKIQGSALGEELAEDAELDDAAAWVARQKQRKADEASAPATVAARPAKRERREEPSSASRSKYDDKDLKDLKVGHKFDNIQEGETVILTLADAPVLDSKTRVVSDAADVLENVSIRDKERHQKIEEEKKRIKSGRVYDPYAEHKSILSQYDEEEERVTFSLGSAVADAAAPSRDEVKARLAAMPTVSLGDSKVVASEYLTAEEVKFKTAKPKKIVRKKKTSALVKELEEAATVEEEAAAADHGSRSQVLAGREAEDAAAKADRARIQRENYAKAQEKATAASATLLPPPDPKKKPAAAVATKFARKAARDDEPFQDEAEEEMLAAVTAARATNQVIRPADIAEAVMARRAIVKKEEEEEAEAENKAVTGGASTEVTFSSTTEFLRAVHPTSAMDRSSTAAAAASKSAERAAAAAANAEATKAAMEIDAVEGEDASSKAAADDRSAAGGEDDSSETALPAEPMVGRSMTAALQYVQQRGHGLEKDLEVYSGRKSDKPIRPQEQGPGEVRLMYVDEFGVQMTPKEAWRHMCHAFHGKHPSKNKREKMLKRRDAMMEAKKAGGTADLVGQVDTMIKTQQKLQSPFIVVSSSTPAPLIAAAAHAAAAAKPVPAASGPIKIESFSLKPKAAKR